MEKDIATVNDPSIPLELRVAAGARLWDISRRAKSALDSLKSVLRTEAMERLGCAGVVTIEGVGMTRALVTIPESTLAIKNANCFPKLKHTLGKQFASLFEEVTVYRCRPDIKFSIALLQPQDRTAVLSEVQEIEGMPRVSFQFAGSNLLDLGSETENTP